MYKGFEIYTAFDGNKYAYSIWEENDFYGARYYNETDHVFDSEEDAEHAAMIWIDKFLLNEGD